MGVYAYGQTQLNPCCSHTLSIHIQNNRIQAPRIRQPVAVYLLELGLGPRAYAISA